MTDPALPDSPASVPPPLPGAALRVRRHRPERARGHQVNKSRKWILVVAVLQLLFGVFFGFMNSKESDAAIRHLAQFEDDEEVEAEGKQYVVSDLRAQIERERIQAYAVPIGLGIAFLVMWWWAKRAALAAMVCALLLFLTVHAIEAAIDPMQIARGIILKVFFIAAMLAGIKAALAQRVAERAEADQGAAMDSAG